MSKFQDYIPQALPVYRGLPSYPGGASGDAHYHNYLQPQAGGDYTTFKYALPHDGTNYLIPQMLVKRAAGGAAIAAFALYKIDGTAAQLYLSIPTNTISNLDDTPVYEAVLFDHQRHSATGTSIGTPYYFVFNDGANHWYSEVFEFFHSDTISGVAPQLTLPAKCSDVEWIQLLWSNPGCVLSETYPAAAALVLNLQATLGRPSYKYSPETEDDGQGGLITTFQRMDKRWEFFVVGPEYLADTITSIQMFSEVGIVFQYGDTVECSDVEVETEWITNGFCKITFRFTSTFLKRTACCA